MFLAPYTAIADIDGSPLDAGFLFFGEYNKDPELFPVEVFWDADFTVPAAQPIRTRNGYPVRNGSPTKVYLKTAQHSIVIKNRNSAFILVDFKNKGWDASFVVDGDENQKQINAKKVTFLSSVQKLINFKNPEDGQLFNVIGYSEGWAVESVFLGPLGGGDFVFSATLETNPDGGSIISPTSGAGRFIRLKTSVVCPEDFGVDHKGLSESTAAMAACLNYAIKNKSKVIAQNSYLVDSINVSSVAGILDLNLTGTIKRRNAASVGDLIALGDKDGIEIYGGGTFDFNHQNQALWSDGVTADSAKIFDVRGLNFINAKKTAIYTKSRNFDYISIKSNIFKEGALHSGVAGEFCTFVITRGGKSVNVKCNKFIQNTSSGANQNRTPCGYLNIDTGATSANGSFSIKYNYFENLGMYCASNLLSPLDFYSYADQIEIKHNKFRLCNLTPIRTSSGKNIDISKNDITQTKAQIIDGGAAYAEAAMIAAGLVDRGYATDKNDVANALVSNNTLISQGVACRAVSCSSNSTTNIFRVLSVLENTMRSSGENSAEGVFANAIQCVEVSGGQIEGFGTGVRFQGTSNNTAIVSDGNASLNIKKLKVKNCLTGIFARDSVTNADIYIENSQLIGSTNLSFTVRNAASLSVKGTRLGGQRGDVSALPVFIFKDNIPGTSSLPVGHDTCTYFRLKDNIGQIDAVSV